MNSRTCAIYNLTVFRRDEPACTCVECGIFVHEHCVVNPAHVLNGNISCVGHESSTAKPTTNAAVSTVPPLLFTAASRAPKRSKAMPTCSAIPASQPVAPASKRQVSSLSPSSENATKLHRASAGHRRSLSASDSLTTVPTSATGVASMPASDSYEAPRWFKNYLNEFHDLQSSVQELQSSMSRRIENVEAKLTDHEVRLTAMNAKICTLRTEASGSAQPVTTTPTPAHEAFEILVTGIPHGLALSNSDFVQKLLFFLNLTHHISFIVNSRSWVDQRQNEDTADNLFVALFSAAPQPTCAIRSPLQPASCVRPTAQPFSARAAKAAYIFALSGPSLCMSSTGRL